MNQDALAKMMEDFGAMLKKTTDSEMTQLRQTLQELADNLSKAGGDIGSGVDKVIEGLDKGTAELLTRVEGISANLAAGATGLQGATDGVKAAMDGILHPNPRFSRSTLASKNILTPDR
jgi:hypothetical protein